MARGIQIFSILMVAFIARLIFFDSPLWSDEYFSHKIITQPNLLFFFLQVSGADVYPPLGYLPSWIIARFTDSHLAMRIPSLLAGIGCVYVGVLIVEKFDKRILLPGLLLALMPLGIYYSVEAKAYSIFALFNLITLYCVLDEQYSKAGIAQALACWTFWTAPLFIIPLILIDSRAWKPLIIGCLSLIPLAPFFIKTLFIHQGIIDVHPLFTIADFSMGFWNQWQMGIIVGIPFIVLLFFSDKRLTIYSMLPMILLYLTSSFACAYTDRSLLACGYVFALAAGIGCNRLSEHI